MRSIKTVLILIVMVLVATLLATGMAYSDDHGRGGGYYGGGHHDGGHHDGGHHGWGHGGWGHYGGWRGWGPWWYYPYYYPLYYSNYYSYYPYYYPSTVIAPSAPSAYIEREQEEPRPEPASRPSGIWYYCPESKAYYPYVKECPGGWQTLPAEPRR